MLTNVRNCNIEPSYGSDHSLVVLEIVFNPFVVKIKGLYTLYIQQLFVI